MAETSASNTDNPAVSNEVLISHLTSDNVFKIARAVRLLGREPRQELVSYVAFLTESESADIRQLSIEALLAYLPNEEAQKAVNKLAKDSSWEVRFHLLNEIKKYAVYHATPAIAVLLADSHPKIRLKAIEIALYFRTKDLIQPLINRLKDEDDECLIATVEALAEIGKPPTVTAFIETLENGRKLAKIKVLNHIFQFDSPKIQPTVKNLLVHKDAEIRAETLRQLGLHNQQWAAPFIWKLLKDKEESVRLQAIKTFMVIGSEERINLLVSMSSDPSPKIREAVIAGFRELEDPQGIQALDKMLEKETEPRLVGLINAAKKELKAHEKE